MFHKEGKQIISVATITFIFLVFLCFKFTSSFIFYFIIIVSTLLYLFIVSFFRNPRRVTFSNDGDVIAPVDGKVVVIEEVIENEYFNDKRIQISIFMSPLNVHVTRYPLSGIVKYLKYHPGKFLVAWHPKSSTENERTTVVVEQNNVEVLFRQIAGALARRIVLYSKKDQCVIAGDDFGFIKFGSRVDLFLPLNTEIKVQLHQKTKGGVTKIATLE